MTDYRPKHMIDREATLDRWQAQAASAATLMSTQRLDAQEGQVWALLECLGASRELNEILYYYGERDCYVPLHLAQPAKPDARRCGCGDIARYPNGCCESGCQNRPA